MDLFSLSNESYIYEHLLRLDTNAEEISSFIVSPNGQGLENYIRNISCKNERSNLDRTYLVRDKKSGEIAAYFSLRAGSIVLQKTETTFDTIPGIELSNFAVNQLYKQHHANIAGIGTMVFADFILPLVNYQKNFIGVSALYIFALPDQKLVQYYKKLGFNRLEQEKEIFLNGHVKPVYDEACIFMFQTL